MSGYRHPKSSALDCVLSSFQMTNETINIWTHFLPTWYFVWRLLVLSSSLDFCREPYHWPLLIYLLLVCLYPFASSCAHTFSTMSARARHFWVTGGQLFEETDTENEHCDNIAKESEVAIYNSAVHNTIVTFKQSRASHATGSSDDNSLAPLPCMQHS
nr:PREDICTED: progestin and adipoQ receptor family member 6 [Struthio camelus australis]